MLLLISSASAENTLQLHGEAPFEKDASLLEVFFISLARDDGFLLRLNGQTLLIDGGLEAEFPLLRDFLLEENGSLSVDAMLNTHQHEDHIQGALALLQRAHYPKVFFGPLAQTTQSSYYKTLFSLLKKGEVPYVQLRPGDCLLFGGGAPGDPPQLAADDFSIWPETAAQIQVYRCEEDLGDINSSCLILYISYGDSSLLLLADAVGRPQSYLLENYPPETFKADVLKVAHHGLSLTVQAFMDAVSPQLAIVTNAPKNTADQNRQFTQRGIPALYTSEGTVYLATDGERWYARQE